MIANMVLINIFMFIASAIVEWTIGDYERMLAYYGLNVSDGLFAYQETIFLIAYLLSFLLPVLIFRIIMGKRRIEPMRLGVALSPETPLVMWSSIAINFAIVYINVMVCSALGIEFSATDTGELMNSPVKILISFISLAIVPALCEEFMFRGCILSNLLPYGKTTAIIGSAVLFSMMHGNPAQFLYTFVGGIMLGYLYVESGSIWPSTFLHLFNNFFSLVEDVLVDNSAPDYAYAILYALEFALVIGGLAIIAYLVHRRSKNEPVEALAKPTMKLALSEGVAIKGFFRPVMIVFIVLTVSEAAIYLLSFMFA
jgi:membrane protease YdiL (CAAX protease family)